MTTKSSSSSSSSSCNRYECHVEINETVLSNVLSSSSSSLKCATSLVGSIDQGTSSSRFLLVTRNGEVLSSAQVEFEQLFPSHFKDSSKKDEDVEEEEEACEVAVVGWHEQNPFAIWDSVVICLERTFLELQKRGCVFAGNKNDGGNKDDKNDGKANVEIAGIGIANQRETTIAWNDRSGEVYYNAIVWDDARTGKVADELCRELGSQDALREDTGLPLASYFAGTKVRWLLTHVHALRKDWQDPGERAHVRFGTVDVWLLYMLTGRAREESVVSNVGGGVGPSGDTSSDTSNDTFRRRLAHAGGEFRTDVSNASRWLFMNLRTLQWERRLAEAVCGPKFPLETALPCISASSNAALGRVQCFPDKMSELQKVPIAAILGDQQAALFGQACFRPGEAKCTYGTGLFLMMNTGRHLVPSNHGLLTTVAYQCGPQSPPVYALEGSVAFSGSTLQWMRDRLQLLPSAKDSEPLAASLSSNGDMYLVPAFSGLFAPYWKPTARGCIVGLTLSHTKAHIVRAALESSAYQAKDVFHAMMQDCSSVNTATTLNQLRVDGGSTKNSFLMQFQANILNVSVVRPAHLETTALGAAFAAGLAVGVYDSMQDIQQLWKKDVVWTCKMTDNERNKCWNGWKKAVQKSFDWVE